MQQPQLQGISSGDIDQYLVLKEQKIAIVATDAFGDLVFGTRVFKPNGEKARQTIPIDRAAVQQYKDAVTAEYDAKLKNINALLTDMDAALKSAAPQ